eukprot:CAMPEP_0185274822 /NCGR_PEP_ID=MMETSP1359-20130426/52688_1 /TAXON_ID=552665 /ORGANISM="Bigelowiella longifila, Strain CCMP242" /LENGTH=321 /DNA_ID=CAMNT_0027867933 /DNA_START=267 /DNA_END=1232 /DNA_ORIENTATION=+
MCLLDIKIKEISYKNLMKGVSQYEKPRFLTADAAARQMLEVEREKKGGILALDSPVMAVCRAGQTDQLIVSGSLGEFQHLDFGMPLHTLVLPGHLHVLEKEMFLHFHWSNIIPEQKVKIPESVCRKAGALRFLKDPAAAAMTPTTAKTSGEGGKGSQKPRDILELVHLLTAGPQTKRGEKKGGDGRAKASYEEESGGRELEGLSPFQQHMLSAARRFLRSNPMEDKRGDSGDEDENGKEEVSAVDGKGGNASSSDSYQERLLAQKRWRERSAQKMKGFGSASKVRKNEEEEEEDEEEDDEDDENNAMEGNDPDLKSFLFQK